MRTLDELRTLLRAIERQVQEYLAGAAAAVAAHDLDGAAASFARRLRSTRRTSAHERWMSRFQMH